MLIESVNTDLILGLLLPAMHNYWASSCDSFLFSVDFSQEIQYPTRIIWYTVIWPTLEMEVINVSSLILQ